MNVFFIFQTRQSDPKLAGFGSISHLRFHKISLSGSVCIGITPWRNMRGAASEIQQKDSAEFSQIGRQRLCSGETVYADMN